MDKIKQDLLSYLYSRHVEYYDDAISIDARDERNADDYIKFLNFKEMRITNSAMRDRVLDKIRGIDTFEGKLEFIKEFFNESFLYDYNLIFKQRFVVKRTFDMSGLKFSCMSIPSPVDGQLSPNVYLTKCGQCTTFTNEVKWFMDKLGIENEIVHEKDAQCFNPFKKSEDRIPHQYNKIVYQGRIYYLDISREIMNRDKKILETVSESGE